MSDQIDPQIHAAWITTAGGIVATMLTGLVAGWRWLFSRREDCQKCKMVCERLTTALDLMLDMVEGSGAHGPEFSGMGHTVRDIISEAKHFLKGNP